MAKRSRTESYPFTAGSPPPAFTTGSPPPPPPFNAGSTPSSTRRQPITAKRPAAATLSSACTGTAESLFVISQPLLGSPFVKMKKDRSSSTLKSPLMEQHVSSMTPTMRDMEQKRFKEDEKDGIDAVDDVEEELEFLESVKPDDKLSENVGAWFALLQKQQDEQVDIRKMISKKKQERSAAKQRLRNMRQEKRYREEAYLEQEDHQLNGTDQLDKIQRNKKPRFENEENNNTQNEENDRNNVEKMELDSPDDRKFAMGVNPRSTNGSRKGRRASAGRVFMPQRNVSTSDNNVAAGKQMMRRLLSFQQQVLT